MEGSTSQAPQEEITDEGVEGMRSSLNSGTTASPLGSRAPSQRRLSGGLMMLPMNKQCGGCGAGGGQVNIQK